MAIDREKILQAAQKLVDKKKFDKAIAEYQKIVQHDPNDARTLLKIGDLQAHMEAYAEAIATYDRVGQFYASQGFSLKAIAVYKQIRELIRKHVPDLADRYGHIVPKLAEIYTQLGLTSDALAAYDEVATRLQRAGRDRDAIDVFRKMVALDSTNPLPHLRLAEACCRVQAVDQAIDSFWTAAELLIQLKRRDDALKVVERILHFKQDTRFARVAAELYLQRGGPQDGLQALAKLQLCFQQDPKNLETLELLAQAFIAIGQEPKAIEVKKELARLAREQGQQEIFQSALGYLLEVAPYDDAVQALASGTLSSFAPESSAVSVEDVELIESSVRPEPKPRAVLASQQDVDPDDIDFDENPLSRRGSLGSTTDVEVEEITNSDVDDGGRPFMVSAPELLVDDELEVADELLEVHSIDARAHGRKAVVDAESFRSLRLYSRAIETLRIALELEPRSIEIREKLKEVLTEAGDQDGTIGEMITLAAIHMDAGDHHRAESELYAILEIDPSHPTAAEMLEQLDAGGIAVAPAYDEREPYAEPYTTEDFNAPVEPEYADGYDPEAPLPSYDLEEIPAEAAMAPRAARVQLEVDDPFDAQAAAESEAPLPSFPLGMDDALDEPHEAHPRQGRGPALNAIDPEIPRAAPVPHVEAALPPLSNEGVEEVLEEAEFYTTRGLLEDARVIITEALARSPNHPLLTEKLAEIDATLSPSGDSGARDRTELEVLEPEAVEDDHVFDIAASLDALDELEQVTRSSRPPSSIKPVEEIDVDQLFAKFKEGVRQQVSDSDSSTHYDLGVAYKEMGLLPDAISEFELAARDAKLACMCFAMIGMINLERGDLDRAAEAYVKGLGAAHKTIDQEMALYYDLGNVHEMKGQSDEALYYFQKIARRDPGYRDVKDRIDALKPPEPVKAVPRGRALHDDDEFDAAFDDLFESK